MQRAVHRLGLGLALQSSVAAAVRHAEPSALQELLKNVSGDGLHEVASAGASQAGCNRLQAGEQRDTSLDTAAAAASLQLDEDFIRLLEEWPSLSRRQSIGTADAIWELEGIAGRSHQRGANSIPPANSEALLPADTIITARGSLQSGAAHGSPFGGLSLLPYSAKPKQSPVSAAIAAEVGSSAAAGSKPQHEASQQDGRQQLRLPQLVPVPFQEIRQYISSPFVGVKPLNLSITSLAQPQPCKLLLHAPAASAAPASTAAATAYGPRLTAPQQMQPLPQKQKQQQQQDRWPQEHGCLRMPAADTAAFAPGAAAAANNSSYNHNYKYHLNTQPAVSRKLSGKRPNKVHSSTRRRQELHSAEVQHKALTGQLAALTAANHQLQQQYDRLSTAYDASLPYLLYLDAEAHSSSSSTGSSSSRESSSQNDSGTSWQQQQLLLHDLLQRLVQGSCQPVAAAGSSLFGMEQLWQAEETVETVITLFQSQSDS